MTIKIDLQFAIKSKTLPTKNDFKTWVNEACVNRIDNIELCIRIIDEKESARLNKIFRGKDYPTNILSFPYESDTLSEESTPLIGDLAICAAIIEQEAKTQQTELPAHWAHIVIHGCLHLLGYDHQTEKHAKKMENLEAEILKKIGYDDPYLL